MVSSAIEQEQAILATSVRVTDEAITVDLDDGRTISVPTAWYPRLLHANHKERANYEIDAVGVAWPDVEADFSVRALLLGRKSGESSESFNFWLANRNSGRQATVEDFLQHRKRQKQSGTRSGLGEVEDFLQRLPIYRHKHPLSQKLCREVVKFAFARYGLMPKTTGSGHLQFESFLHVETVASRYASLTINLIGRPADYEKIPAVRNLLVKPRPGQVRLRLSNVDQLDVLFQAIEQSHRIAEKRRTGKGKA